MFEKAAGLDADLVLLDLEDAVAPSQKLAAREKAVNALNTCDWGMTARAVRINGLDTEWAHDDIIQVVSGARDNLDTIIVPKVTRARDVWWVDVLLTQLESKLKLTKPIRLEVLIEDVSGLANAQTIACASRRLDALILGAGDLSISQGCRVDTNFRPSGSYPGDFWHYARSQVVVAARSAGIIAIDTPYPDYGDSAGFEADARMSALLGYSGKWAIHPSQVGIANDVYAPTADEIARAKRNIAAYDEGAKAGKGAVSLDGMLVDAAHVRLARDVLRRAQVVVERA